MKEIAFDIKNEFNYVISLCVEPFGIGFDLNPNNSYKAFFLSTKGHDISDDIAIIFHHKMVTVDIKGGWILFKLFSENELVIELEI